MIMQDEFSSLVLSLGMKGTPNTKERNVWTVNLFPNKLSDFNGEKYIFSSKYCDFEIIIMFVGFEPRDF
jgi:hypothetical protein